MKNRVLIVCLLAFLSLNSINASKRRVKRAALTNCNPSTNDKDDVVDQGDTMTLSCNTDDTVAACIWRHIDPISEKDQGYASAEAVLCTGTSESNGKQCQDESRVTFRGSINTCAIDVTNTKPEDTGRWTLTAVTLSSTGQHNVIHDFRAQLCQY